MLSTPTHPQVSNFRENEPVPLLLPTRFPYRSITISFYMLDSFKCTAFLGDNFSQSARGVGEAALEWLRAPSVEPYARLEPRHFSQLQLPLCRVACVISSFAPSVSNELALLDDSLARILSHSVVDANRNCVTSQLRSLPPLAV